MNEIARCAMAWLVSGLLASCFILSMVANAERRPTDDERPEDEG